ncbi:aromatic-ring-hydroxylating dioxygenase subunit beta [Kerstersia sp.]|uniref:aromatic-ring-hydroxylating dioxygenase subunit beta n=1 Tax=Kerstersia sp. TaxID=1930783 RepID=UPI003F908A48
MKTSSKEQVLDFLHTENQLLDEQRHEEWLTLFHPDAHYWIPAQAGQSDPLLHISLCHENLELLTMRIARLRHPQAHGLAQPIRTSRMLCNVRISEQDNGAILASGHFLVHEWQGERLRQFAGQVDYSLRMGHELKITQKKISLVNVEAPFEAIQILL